MPRLPGEHATAPPIAHGALPLPLAFIGLVSLTAASLIFVLLTDG